MTDCDALDPAVPRHDCPAAMWDVGAAHTCRRFSFALVQQNHAHFLVHREGERFRVDLRNAPLRWKLPELLKVRIGSGGSKLTTLTVNRCVIERIRAEDLEHVLDALRLAVRTRG